jgi:hypothetical protein
VLIEARDNAGAATKSSTGMLTVTVDRNLRDPYFLTTNYQQTILEIQDVNVPFLNVSARDDDTLVSLVLAFVRCVHVVWMKEGGKIFYLYVIPPKNENILICLIYFGVEDWPGFTTVL